MRLVRVLTACSAAVPCRDDKERYRTLAILRVLYQLVDVFLDEAGDLGFKEGKSSRYLVVCALATPSPHRYGRIVKSLNRRFRVKKKGAVEFKFNNSTEQIRLFVLDEVSRTDSWMVWGAIEKKNAEPELRSRKDKLYNYVCGRVLSEMFRATPTKSIHLIVDKRAGRSSHRNDFDRCVEQQLNSSHAGYFPPELLASHFDSRTHEELQIDDFCAGAVFQKVESPSFTLR